MHSITSRPRETGHGVLDRRRRGRKASSTGWRTVSVPPSFLPPSRWARGGMGNRANQPASPAQPSHPVSAAARTCKIIHGTSLKMVVRTVINPSWEREGVEEAAPQRRRRKAEIGFKHPLLATPFLGVSPPAPLYGSKYDHSTTPHTHYRLAPVKGRGEKKTGERGRTSLGGASGCRSSSGERGGREGGREGGKESRGSWGVMVGGWC